MNTAIRGALVALFLIMLSPAVAEEVDLRVIHRIKTEAFHHSKVMDYIHLIADENGPRISGSPGYARAAKLAVKAYNEVGIEQADLESWGTFGRGWDWSRVAVQMKLPYVSTLSAYPADFSPGTDTPVTGSVVFAPIWEKGEAPENGDLEKYAHQIEAWKDKYRGQLRGKIRGVYLQQNDMARPIMEAWMHPFADLGVGTATIINTTGTDHLSFNDVGLPGFNFVQDPLDYSLNTHHSNVDHVDHLIPGDLMQAAAVMAAVVFHAANREEMIPRKPLPAPLPEKNELPEILR